MDDNKGQVHAHLAEIRAALEEQPVGNRQFMRNRALKHDFLRRRLVARGREILQDTERRRIREQEDEAERLRSTRPDPEVESRQEALEKITRVMQRADERVKAAEAKPEPSGERVVTWDQPWYRGGRLVAVTKERRVIR